MELDGWDYKQPPPRHGSRGPPPSSFSSMGAYGYPARSNPFSPPGQPHNPYSPYSTATGYNNFDTYAPPPAQPSQSFMPPSYPQPGMSPYPPYGMPGYEQSPPWAYPPPPPPKEERTDDSKTMEHLKELKVLVTKQEEARLAAELARLKAESGKEKEWLAASKLREETAMAVKKAREDHMVALERTRQRYELQAAEAAEKARRDHEEAMEKTRHEHEAAAKRAQDEYNMKLEKAESAKKTAEKKQKASHEEAAKLNPLDLTLAPIKFKDALGRKFSFPFYLCKTWKGMELLIKQASSHIIIDGFGEHVYYGHYDLTNLDGEIILPQVWDTMVRPDWDIAMHLWPMKEEEEGHKHDNLADDMRMVEEKEQQLKDLDAVAAHQGQRHRVDSNDDDIVEVIEGHTSSGPVEDRVRLYDYFLDHPPPPRKVLFWDLPSTTRKPSDHWASALTDVDKDFTPFLSSGQYPYLSHFGETVKKDCTALDRLAIEGSLHGKYFIVQLYWRSSDGDARILVQRRITERREPSYYLLPLTSLEIRRFRSSLQLCETQNDDADDFWATADASLWADLNFDSYERLVLFYCTFTAMKHQYLRSLGPDSPDNPRALAGEDDDDEDEEWGGGVFVRVDEDRTGILTLRLLRDTASCAFRLEACASDNVPVWTAFVTQYTDDPQWVVDVSDVDDRYQYSGVVVIGPFRIAPYVFMSEYQPWLSENANLVLEFFERGEAESFARCWSNICEAVTTDESAEVVSDSESGEEI